MKEGHDVGRVTDARTTSAVVKLTLEIDESARMSWLRHLVHLSLPRPAACGMPVYGVSYQRRLVTSWELASSPRRRCQFGELAKETECRASLRRCPSSPLAAMVKLTAEIAESCVLSVSAWCPSLSAASRPRNASCWCLPRESRLQAGGTERRCIRRRSCGEARPCQDVAHPVRTW